MKYYAKGGIPATIETTPNPYKGLPWVALVHRSDDTPATRFLTFQGTTEKAAAAAAIAWLGGKLTPRATMAQSLDGSLLCERCLFAQCGEDVPRTTVWIDSEGRCSGLGCR